MFTIAIYTPNELLSEHHFRDEGRAKAYFHHAIMAHLAEGYDETDRSDEGHWVGEHPYREDIVIDLEINDDEELDDVDGDFSVW